MKKKIKMNMLENLKEIYKKTENNTVKSQKYMSHYYNRNMTKKFYKVGDHVLLEKKSLRTLIRYTIHHHKNKSSCIRTIRLIPIE